VETITEIAKVIVKLTATKLTTAKLITAKLTIQSS
jgi:hypothetical protein